jgi:4'-phosphopantetheinyl transferase
MRFADDRDVHVWDAVIAELQGLRPQLEGTLSGPERRRAARYRFAVHREAFTIRRGLLRVLVGRYAGIEPAAVELDETCAICGGNHGKPQLVGRSELSFSISHSGGRVLCAFAHGVDVGIDIERVDAGTDWTGPARLTLSTRERIELDGLPADRRAQRFYVLWVRKEALAKATGHGLVLPLREIDIAPDGQLRALPEAIRVPATWALHDVEVGRTFAAAVAVRAPAVHVRMMGTPELRAAAIR